MFENGSFLIKRRLITCVGAKNGSLGQDAFVGTYMYIKEWSIDKGLRCFIL